VDKIGVGRGAGFNLNVPWNTGNGRRSIGDAAYLHAFMEVVMPVATQFDPDLVLVSAGFDAAVGDPLGKCQVTPMAYAAMTKYLSVLAEGRVILALEGGYNLKSIAECMTTCGAALLGCPLPKMDAVYRKPLHHRDRDSVEKVKNYLLPFWPFLDSNIVEEEDEKDVENTSLEDFKGMKDGNDDDDKSIGSVDVNRNVKLKSETEDLVEVFEALTIQSESTAASNAEVPAVSPSFSNRKHLDPNLKIRMAEFDFKLAQVPAIVTPEVQEEAKHLIRVLVLGQEGAEAYEKALDNSDGPIAIAPTIPLMAPALSTPDSAASQPASSPSSLGQSPKMTMKEVTLEDSGILEPLVEDAEIKMEND